MAAHGDDVLLDAEVMAPTAWDEEGPTTDESAA
jgi:hypothetical protein